LRTAACDVRDVAPKHRSMAALAVGREAVVSSPTEGAA
jgi:hypothetical protein